MYVCRIWHRDLSRSMLYVQRIMTIVRRLNTRRPAAAKVAQKSKYSVCPSSINKYYARHGPPTNHPPKTPQKLPRPKQTRRCCFAMSITRQLIPRYTNVMFESTHTHTHRIYYYLANSGHRNVITRCAARDFVYLENSVNI